jgi:hypothetical protein
MLFLFVIYLFPCYLRFWVVHFSSNRAKVYKNLARINFKYYYARFFQVFFLLFNRIYVVWLSILSRIELKFFKLSSYCFRLLVS